MTQKKMERIIRGRRISQGIGALGGVFTVFALPGAVYGDDMKKEAEKLASEVQDKIPDKAKELIGEAKGKLGL